MFPGKGGVLGVFSCEVLAVAVGDGSGFGGVAGEVWAVEAVSDVFVVGAGGDLAVGVVFWGAAGGVVGAGVGSHAWASFACDAADADFDGHGLSSWFLSVREDVFCIVLLKSVFWAY
jgi:hypothetical protein